MVNCSVDQHQDHDRALGSARQAAQFPEDPNHRSLYSPTATLLASGGRALSIDGEHITPSLAGTMGQFGLQ